MIALQCFAYMVTGAHSRKVLSADFQSQGDFWKSSSSQRPPSHVIYWHMLMCVIHYVSILLLYWLVVIFYVVWFLMIDAVQSWLTFSFLKLLIWQKSFPIAKLQREHLKRSNNLLNLNDNHQHVHDSSCFFWLPWQKHGSEGSFRQRFNQLFTLFTVGWTNGQHPSGCMCRKIAGQLFPEK